MRKLYIFTATFPYGIAECFCDKELAYLSQQFENIEIIPFIGRNGCKRSVPSNCYVWDPIVRSRREQYLCGLFNWESFKIFFPLAVQNYVWQNRKRLKTWIISYVQSNVLLNSQKIKKLFQSIEKDSICYFYWGRGSNVLSYFYVGRCHFVSRFHGEWDLWEESSGGYIPLRKEIASRLDLAVFISRKGESYFKSKYLACNTAIYPLGSQDAGLGRKSDDGIFRIVSCSTVYPLKRVDLIFQSLLQAKNIQIEWTHIGGGSHFEKLKNEVATCSEGHLTVCLLDQVKHDDVIKYYQTHSVDAFINLSTNEGVPVSIMEAISFDIPVIATNVGGNSEIVTEETGVLLSPNPSPSEVVSAIQVVYMQSFAPRSFWKRHYNAEINYLTFADSLKKL